MWSRITQNPQKNKQGKTFHADKRSNPINSFFYFFSFMFFFSKRNMRKVRWKTVIVQHYTTAYWVSYKKRKKQPIRVQLVCSCEKLSFVDVSGWFECEMTELWQISTISSARIVTKTLIVSFVSRRVCLFHQVEENNGKRLMHTSRFFYFLFLNF